MRGFTHRLPGLVLTEHVFSVPLDHARSDGPRLRLFAREAVSPDHEGQDLPWLVFLQGGPGYGAPRPPAEAAWLPRALADYRVLLLDQRGTGRSTPVLPATLATLPDAAAGADYLTHFRADAIVRDAELVREELLGPGSRWTVLGQSYGGFCAVHYLSAAPEGLDAVLITGGLPPLVDSVDAVYHATTPGVLAKNGAYFERYPEDGERIGRIASQLAQGDIRLPTGDRLTLPMLQQLGLAFGMSDGYERVHYLLELAYLDGAPGELSLPFLHGVAGDLAHGTHPIFSVLHEAAYCEGFASRWAAQRLRDEHDPFAAGHDGHPLFTGEMIYPWMFEAYGDLAPFAAAAQLLADKDDWPPLYDRAALAANTVPCAAAIYHDDMYVERELSRATAAAIGGLRPWITNSYEHDGLRLHGDIVLDRLLDMVGGRR